MKVVVLLAALSCAGGVSAQSTFAVASIRPSAKSVQFESDGETQLRSTTLQMRDVTIETCIKWAYSVQRSQVSGPRLLTSERYDITAKMDAPTKEEEAKAMMRSLLQERFGLAFHWEKKELRSFALVVVKGKGVLKPALPNEEPYRKNSAMGTVARATTMQEFADFLAGPLEKPVVDKTGLAGRWDFSFDFTKYLSDPPKSPDDFLVVLNETLQGEVGLKLLPEKDVVEVLVVDRVEKASEN